LLASAPVRVTAAGTAPAITPLAQISAADQGRQVTIQGTVVGTDNFSAGFKLHVNDATAQAIVLIWASDYDHIYNSYGLNIGAVVRVNGQVDVYDGQVEIVPERGSDVDIVSRAPRDWRKVDLGGLSGNDHNALVQVEGTVADITPFEYGAYLLIADATGAQKVKLYDVVARRIPRREQLWIGQQVSVVGRVKARRKAGIEIVPALPHDVHVATQGAGATP
jgi:RecJ-like exonuclease